MESKPFVSTSSRPHPERLRVGTYPVQHGIDARFGDQDANGHLNNLALESLHENARATLNTQVFPGVYDRAAARRLRIVTASNVVHFLSEAHWPATIQTAIGIGHVGHTSWIASSALFIDGACISSCDTVLVLLADAGPTPIPDDAREQLDGLRLRLG